MSLAYLLLNVTLLLNKQRQNGYRFDYIQT